MAERVAITAPPIDFGDANDPRRMREWLRKVAQSVRQILTVRPTPILVAHTPAAIDADQDDYEHGQVDVLRVSSSVTPRTFSGFDNQGFRDFWIVNVGANAFLLGHEDTGSAAANRIISKTGAAVSVTASASLRLWYDADSSRWRILGE